MAKGFGDPADAGGSFCEPVCVAALQFAPPPITVSLGPGTRLGPYEVIAAIGAGGMGEVYRARDTKLNRDVALKILPAAFASDADRLARFHREAQVLASLNHPHIGAIYGFEDSGETHALVLEFVDGPTSPDRIAQGPASTQSVPSTFTSTENEKGGPKGPPLRTTRTKNGPNDPNARTIRTTTGTTP